MTVTDKILNKVVSEYRQAKREIKIADFQMYADAGFTINATAEILQICPVKLRTFSYNNKIKFRKARNGKQTTIRE